MPYLEVMRTDSDLEQTRPLRLIVNPAASGGRGRKAATELIRVLEGRGMRCDARYTRAPGHAEELAGEAVREGVHPVVVVGGDGTVHEVAQGLLGRGADAGSPDARSPDCLPPLAVLPVGTGNDFHRMVGADRSAETVAELLGEGEVERFDVGRVRWENGERVFVNLLGVGIDVDILRCRTRFQRLRGLIQYLAALLNAMVTFRAPEVEIDVGGSDGRRIRSGTTLSVITVGPSIGGGFMINPAARASDGKLDLCHCAAMGWLRLLSLVPRVIRGTHGESPLVTMCQIERAVVRRPGGDPLWFEMDGELAPQPARELRVEVVPSALPVLVPAHG